MKPRLCVLLLLCKLLAPQTETALRQCLGRGSGRMGTLSADSHIKPRQVSGILRGGFAVSSGIQSTPRSPLTLGGALVNISLGTHGGGITYAGFHIGLSYFHPAMPMRPVDRTPSLKSLTNFVPSNFNTNEIWNCGYACKCDCSFSLLPSLGV